MKYTAIVLFLTAFGLAKADNLKVEKKEGTYPEWKKLAESVNSLVEKKHKDLTDLSSKLDAEPKKKVDAEIVKVKTELDKVVADTKTIIDLDKTEFAKADDDAKKQVVVGKAAKAAVTLAEKLVDFETALKKANLLYTKEKVTNEGHIRLLDFLKAKVKNIEQDGFLTSSLLAALALSAVAVGSTFN